MNKDLQVFIVEKTNKLLSKVKVSGGGRCNVTNACNDIDEMSKCYPRGYNFVKKTFHQFFITDIIQWFFDDSGFHRIICDFICIAVGGYATASKFQWIQTLGHTIAQPVPTLFTFNLPAGQADLPKHPITSLMGISVVKPRKNKWQ
ncbi:MAG: NAD(P)/FAD-dependent oxidoreductase [Chitinophagaceae bacterium]